MDQQTNYIAFLCYGDKGVFYECAYALLSLSRLYPSGPPNTEIWIYTDDAAWFRSFKDCKLPIHYREIDKTTIQQWRGEINFVHRIKIELLKDLTKEKAGNILYVDTDVVFTHNIDSILDGINDGLLYMHTMEGIISNRGNPIFRKLNDHLKKDTANKVNGKPLQDLAMWNAGVLGFNTRHKHLLDEVLAFTDSEYPKLPKHVIEQFAFSVYFQREDNVKAAAPYIFHYWKLKEAREMLASFFDYFKGKTWEELTRYSSFIQMPALMQEKVNYLHGRSISAHLRNKQWHPAKQNWAEMIKQL